MTGPSEWKREPDSVPKGLTAEEVRRGRESRSQSIPLALGGILFRTGYLPGFGACRGEEGI